MTIKTSNLNLTHSPTHTQKKSVQLESRSFNNCFNKSC